MVNIHIKKIIFQLNTSEKNTCSFDWVVCFFDIELHELFVYFD